MPALSEPCCVDEYILNYSNLWSINSARRLATATDAPKPSKSTPPPVFPVGDPTIKRIVDDISGLTLLQAAELVSLLKVRNIQLLVIKKRIHSVFIL